MDTVNTRVVIHKANIEKNSRSRTGIHPEQLFSRILDVQDRFLPPEGKKQIL